MSEPTTAEWADHGLMALDHLESLYYADGGGMTVADFRAAVEAVRSSLEAARAASTPEVPFPTGVVQMALNDQPGQAIVRVNRRALEETLAALRGTQVEGRERLDRVRETLDRWEREPVWTRPDVIAALRAALASKEARNG